MDGKKVYPNIMMKIQEKLKKLTEQDYLNLLIQPSVSISEKKAKNKLNGITDKNGNNLVSRFDNDWYEKCIQYGKAFFKDGMRKVDTDGVDVLVNPFDVYIQFVKKGIFAQLLQLKNKYDPELNLAAARNLLNDEYEWVSVKHLFINLVFQRITDVAQCILLIIKHGGFDWGKLSNCDIAVYKLANNVYSCTDGGHRIFMAILMGIEYLPVKIIKDFTAQENEIYTPELRIAIQLNDFNNRNNDKTVMSEDRLMQIEARKGDKEKLAFCEMLKEGGVDVGGYNIGGVPTFKSTDTFNNYFTPNKDGGYGIIRLNSNYIGEMPFDTTPDILKRYIKVMNLNGERKGDRVLWKDVRPLIRVHTKIAKKSLNMNITLTDFNNWFKTITSDDYGSVADYVRFDFDKNGKKIGNTSVQECEDLAVIEKIMYHANKKFDSKPLMNEWNIAHIFKRSRPLYSLQLRVLELDKEKLLEKLSLEEK